MYQTSDGKLTIQVRLERETVWPHPADTVELCRLSQIAVLLLLKLTLSK